MGGANIMPELIRLLLVEDDEGYRELVRVHLQDACGPDRAIEVECASTLSAGLAAIGPRTDLIILDLTLPDSSGLETLDRARAAAPGVPIVVLTNLGEETGLEAVAHGAQDFLTKDRINGRLLMRTVAYAHERAKQWACIEELVAKAADALVVVDETGRVQLANPGAAALFGWGAQSVGRLFEYPVEDGAELVVPQGEGAGPRTAEMRVSTLEWRGKRSRLAMIRDVTAVRALEEVRSQIKARQHADMVKDQTMITVAHEIRSPLTIVVAAVQTVLEGGKLSQGQQRMLAMAARSADRITRFTDQMLDFARLESGRAKLSPQPLDMAKVVEQALEGIRVREPMRKGMIKANIPAGLPPAFADPDSAAQLLTNLVENALRFAKSEIVVSLSLGQAEGEKPGVEVTVRDDGPGIAPERLGELFQRFQQLERRGQGYKGTGLGLAICRELAHANHGRVWAESEPGRGSRFHFALPLFAPAPPLARAQ